MPLPASVTDDTAASPLVVIVTVRPDRGRPLRSVTVAVAVVVDRPSATSVSFFSRTVIRESTSCSTAAARTAPAVAVMVSSSAVREALIVAV